MSSEPFHDTRCCVRPRCLRYRITLSTSYTTETSDGATGGADSGRRWNVMSAPPGKLRPARNNEPLPGAACSPIVSTFLPDIRMCITTRTATPRRALLRETTLAWERVRGIGTHLTGRRIVSQFGPKKENHNRNEKSFKMNAKVSAPQPLLTAAWSDAHGIPK